MTALLEARRVGMVFGRGRERKQALSDVDLVIEEGADVFTAVAGESGSGKSTLAGLLLGLLTPTSGTVFYRGKDLRSLSGAERRQFRREVQAIFQDPFAVFNPFYRVEHVLEVAIRVFGLAESRSDAKRLIEENLERVGLKPDEVIGRYPHQLSGGQRQRVTIARALLIRPKLVVADEPVSMVDASLRTSIVDLLNRLHREMGIGFIYITHDLATAYQVSRDIVVLYQGRVMERGGAAAVIEAPAHPYTRDLLAAIPKPVPGREWITAETSGGDEEAGAAVAAGCPYAGRCRHTMDRCRQEMPVLDDAGPGRAKACFLPGTGIRT